jgi:serine/threonine protein kinase
MMINATDFVGSPLFMAPEVIMKDKYNKKADVWSLGIAAIEMAEGRAPNSDIRNMEQLLELPLRPSPTLKNPKLWSPSFVDFLKRCLVKGPDERPDTIELLMVSAHYYII